ncbi:MAG: ACP S-malonyltransferase [Propionibacterium sp.]|nr:ACP S-malonyltransferase [Propionibacterium sp.]
MLAIVAPGQGAQAPGFLTAWLEEPGFRSHLEWLSAVADIDLVAHGTISDADTIRDTSVAQPLLVASAIATFEQIFPFRTGNTADLLAGHSVGELAAAALAGVISTETALVLVRERGRSMAAAAAITPTSMTAIIGGDRDEVLAAVDAAGLTAANNNGPGQLVAAGTVEQLAAFAENTPRRARLKQLSVAGAFHTHHMAPAVARLEALAAAVPTRDPRTKLLSNADGTIVTSGREYLERLVRQVANPVRWDLCMETMSVEGVTGILELAPAGTLTGIAKRNLKGVELFNLNTPDQLDNARAFCESHSASA